MWQWSSLLPLYNARWRHPDCSPLFVYKLSSSCSLHWMSVSRVTDWAGQYLVVRPYLDWSVLTRRMQNNWCDNDQPSITNTTQDCHNYQYPELLTLTPPLVHLELFLHSTQDCSLPWRASRDYLVIKPYRCGSFNVNKTNLVFLLPILFSRV